MPLLCFSDTVLPDCWLQKAVYYTGSFVGIIRAFDQTYGDYEFEQSSSIS
jgi:hypothetical protein